MSCSCSDRASIGGWSREAASDIKLVSSDPILNEALSVCVGQQRGSAGQLCCIDPRNPLALLSLLGTSYLMVHRGREGGVSRFGDWHSSSSAASTTPASKGEKILPSPTYAIRKGKQGRKAFPPADYVRSQNSKKVYVASQKKQQQRGKSRFTLVNPIR